MATTEDLNSSSPLAWIVNNNFITENQKPVEFRNHRFLLDPFYDMSEDMVCMKSAQVGFSVMTILKVMWLAAYKRLNTIYVLPTQNVVKDFVAPKVDPLITSNAPLSKLVSKDSISIKQIGDRFVYYRGAFSEREAISISADVLVVDELDRCPSMAIIATYQSRLQASEYGWQWYFSNPSVPNYGVHERWVDSDQHHWFVKCEHCNHQSFISFEHQEEFKTHYIDKKQKKYVCGNCAGHISDVARKDGQWVAKYPDRARRGYQISQLMVPYVKPEQILASYKKDPPEFFHNFVLGLPYIAADIFVDRQAISKCIAPQTLAKTNVCIGVDNGIVKSVVVGTPNGIFRYFETESWEEIENLFLMYNATMVIDANPYPNIPKKLVEKYPGRVFINYYVQDRKGLGIIRYQTKENNGVVHSDRTKILDNIAAMVVNQELLFALKPSEMEEYIYHWENTYRVVEEDSNGVQKGKWLVKEGKPDHFVHATVYYRIALDKVMNSGFGAIVKSATPQKDIVAPTVKDNQVEGINLEQAILQAGKTKKGWKNV